MGIDMLGKGNCIKQKKTKNNVYYFIKLNYNTDKIIYHFFFVD
jgi:hypothetical protein